MSNGTTSSGGPSGSPDEAAGRADVEDVKRQLAEVFADVRQAIAERQARAAREGQQGS